MPFTPDDIQANHEHFAHHLKSTKSRRDVELRLTGDYTGDEFLLLDVRPREAFANGHIHGAHCAPFAELSELAAELPRDKELVVYCWSDT